MQIKTILVLIAVAAVAYGCKGSSQSNSTSKKSASINELNTAVSSSYEFSNTQCSTGKQAFDSVAKYCTGLQNNTLNKSCAQQSRESLFSKNCLGQTFKSFNEITLSGPYELKKLRNGIVIKDILKTTAESKEKQKSAMADFSCEKTLAAATSSQEDGFIILSGSKVLINRDLNFPQEGSPLASNSKPQALITCADQADELEKVGFFAKKLKPNSDTKAYVTVAANGKNETEFEVITISCFADVESAAASKLNGLAMIKGSKVVIRSEARFNRNVDSNSSSFDLHRVITCN